MVSRPGRPKAEHVSDLDVLTAAAMSNQTRVHPLNALMEKYPEIPGKVFAVKKAKLHQRGLINADWSLTVAGLAIWQGDNE